MSPDESARDEETLIKNALDVPIGTKTEWLTDRIDEIRLATEHRDETLAMIAHELRTPLTVIQGGIWLLRRRGANSEEERDGLLEMLEQQSTHLALMLTNMLSLAASEVGGGLEPEPVVVREEIRTAVTVFQAMAEGRVVHIEEEPDLPPVLSSAGYVQEILVNLLVNAHKYSPQDKPIEIRAVSQDDEEVLISVADHGEGLPAAELDRIFETYYQSSRRARGASGSGLGLAVCKRLTEAQGGQIWANAAESGGLEVAFTLKTCPPA
ncbi:MAG: ATP-binding protein [Chloroflexota bacterium]